MFEDQGVWKRAVTTRGLDDYSALMDSGLADSLMSDGLLVRHDEEPAGSSTPDEACRVFVPEQIGFISYPYEWCFSQLKDAALTTLEIQQRALAHGMSLKDASAFNVQFHRGRPVFIDTLSFERDDGAPWVAYEQFCRHFLGPLLLMKYVSHHAGRLLATDLGGIGLDMVSRMLGWASWFNAGALLHVHLHARAIAGQKHGDARADGAARTGAKAAVAESLRRAVDGACLPTKESAWSSYEMQADHYSQTARDTKRNFVARTLCRMPRGLVYDAGGNTGQYSRAAASSGHDCVLYDSDIECVERAYRQCKQSGEQSILPLRFDFSNPTPALGVNLRERLGSFDRPRAGLVMALALVHHLRLKENIPFAMMASCFARMGDRLLIEWVGPEDPMAGSMLAGKKRPPEYSMGAFLREFSNFFRVVESEPLHGMDRTLLVMECLDSAKP